MSDKEITTQDNKEITESGLNYPALFEAAMNNEKGLEIIERLTALKNAEEDRQAKKDYYLYFSKMQSEFKPVVKNHGGSKTNSGDVAFMYAPIENYQSTNGEIIAKYKFSSKWTEEPLENGVLRVRIHISGWGYTDSSTFTDVPKIPTNSLTTEAQARGAQKGYGRRITYVDGFGMTSIGEDVDAHLSFDDGANYADIEQKLMACTTIEAVNLSTKEIRKELNDKNDNHGVDVLRKLYMKRKKELL